MDKSLSDDTFRKIATIKHVSLQSSKNCVMEKEMWLNFRFKQVMSNDTYGPYL